jgi:hypothetical protein
MSRAAQPAAERQPRRDRLVLERIAAEHLALPGERRIRIEDAKTAADHDDDGNDIYPVRRSHDPVVSLFGQCRLQTLQMLTALLAQLADDDIEASQRSRVR